MLKIPKHKIYAGLYFCFHLIIGIVFSCLACNYVYQETMQIVSNRLYSKNAHAFILKDFSQTDIKLLLNIIDSNQILWKEDSTNIRGIFYHKGIRLPVIEGEQFVWESAKSLNEGQVLTGKNISLLDNQECIGRIGIKDRDSCMDEYILYPISEGMEIRDGKWVLDGYNVLKTITEISSLDFTGEIYLESAKAGGSFRAYESINIDFLYWLTFISILICTSMVGLIWMDKKKVYITVCRFAGIPINKILSKVIKQQFICLGIALICGSLISILFMPKLIYSYSIFNIIFYFFIYQLLNFTANVILITFKLGKWVGNGN